MPVDDETAERIRRLTIQLRAGDDTATDRRDRLLEASGARARVRQDDEGETLIIYPERWVDGDGRVDPTDINDPSEAVSLPLVDTSTPSDDDWPEIDAHNQAVADAVAELHGPVHGATAEALATYLSNHHLRRIEHATEAELRTFSDDYFIRNAWPTQQQRAVLEESIELAVDTATARSAREDLGFDGFSK